MKGGGRGGGGGGGGKGVRRGREGERTTDGGAERGEVSCRGARKRVLEDRSPSCREVQSCTTPGSESGLPILLLISINPPIETRGCRSFASSVQNFQFESRSDVPRVLAHLTEILLKTPFELNGPICAQVKLPMAISKPFSSPWKMGGCIHTLKL